MQTKVLSKLLGRKIEGKHKWSASVLGADDCIYGIPFCARRVVRFNPVDKSLTEIGPDLGDGGWKYEGGVLARNGKIYCAPADASKILIIDTLTQKVKLLHDVELPETGEGLWTSGAYAHDGNIYFMPNCARYILKLNPENNAVASVGEDMGDGFHKYRGAVVAGKGVYCIPEKSRCILKFDPVTQSSSIVGVAAKREFLCCNGVLARDGFIYAANDYGEVIRIDTAKDTYFFVCAKFQVSHRFAGWGDAILGSDGCIYWPPYNARRILKFDPKTHCASVVGDDFGTMLAYAPFKWISGVVSPADGVIYCIPTSASQMLVIDPFKEFIVRLREHMDKCPEERKLGCLFHKNGGETTYESALRKFGEEKVFQIVESLIPSHLECSGHLTESFMVAASYNNCAVSVIYSLLRKNLDSVPILQNYSTQRSLDSLFILSEEKESIMTN